MRGTDVSRKGGPGPLDPGQMPSAEEQRHADGAGGDHSGIFTQEKQGESHGAVFGVISADQFLLRFGDVERGAVGLRVDADKEHDKRQRLGEHIPGGDDFRPVMALLLDQEIQIEGPVHEDDADDGQSKRDLVGDHVDRGPQSAEEGIFVVACPSADDHAIDRQGEDRQDVEHADIEAGDLKGISIGDLVLVGIADADGIADELVSLGQLAFGFLGQGINRLPNGDDALDLAGATPGEHGDADDHDDNHQGRGDGEEDFVHAGRAVILLDDEFQPVGQGLS